MAKVLFVDLLNNFYDQHGVYSLISFMKSHGIDVYFIAERNYRRALFKISKERPDLLLYSAFSSTIPAYV